MRTALLFLLFSTAFLAIGAEPPQAVAPGSDRWKQLFDPPYVTPTELPADSALRKQLFDALRPRIEKLSKRPVRFQGSLRAFKNWAVFVGQTLGADNKEVRFDTPDSLDAVTSAIWLRTRDGWTLVDYYAGLSDWFYPEWFEQFGVPHEFLTTFR